ncbi:MAG: glutamate formimidoyltransferase [Chloroflexi bacterium]|nr:glutamate formimidoyltransferase [Chloroflexota bacterium]
MATIVECVPIFSEGRRDWVIDELLGAVRSVAGVRVLEVEKDPDHNRTVVAFAGAPEPVLEAAFRVVRRAADLIDLDQHEGAHPRIGAADVVPFVPVAGVSLADCAELARRLGRRLGEELGLPVYLYGKAATRPERRELPDIRRGEYEGLKVAIASDPARAPDFGPARLGPAGATVVGARLPLIAYNINLQTDDVAVAKTIARKVRESAGGLPAVRAIGLSLAGTGQVQVSLNLTDYRRTGLLTAFRAVSDEAASPGVEVAGSHVVGLLPAEALAEVVAETLRSPNFAADRILERALLVRAEEEPS